MPEPVNLLLLQFLAWVASRTRTYAEAMDAWRTSCPRLSVWEDALIDGLIQVEGTNPAQVALTPRGRAVLAASTSAPLGPGPAQARPVRQLGPDAGHAFPSA